jgi:hypothetical protein
MTTELDREKPAEFPAQPDHELTEYLWGKLTLAVSLACQGEQERRSGHLASAEESQRKWGDVMAEVKRLSPLVRKSGAPSIATEKPPRQKRRLPPSPESL